MTLRELHDRLENDNHHGLTAMLVAVAAEDYEAVIRLGEIIKIHMAQGNMTGALCTERYEISQPCYDALVADGSLA